jgi:hypothetical protein
MSKLTKAELCAVIPVKVKKNLYRVVYDTFWGVRQELEAVVAEHEIEVARFVREQKSATVVTKIELLQKDILA